MALNRDDFQRLFKNDLEVEDGSKKVHPSKLHSNGTNCSEMGFNLRFSDNYHTEQSISIFLASVGFSFNDSGTKYLMFILCECINEMDMTINTAKYLTRCSEKYNIMPNNIRIAIEKSISRAAKKKGDARLDKINEIFNGEYITNTKISTSMFVSCVAHRFIIVKKYDKVLQYVPAAKR